MLLFDNIGGLAPILRALILTAGAVAWIFALARLVGLRAFRRATAFDCAATTATGSLIAQAGTRSEWGQYAQAMASAFRTVQEEILPTGTTEKGWLTRDGGTPSSTDQTMNGVGA